MQGRPSTIQTHQSRTIDGQNGIERARWRVPAHHAEDLVLFLQDLGLNPHDVEFSVKVFEKKREVQT